jgi:hypothetical protein
MNEGETLQQAWKAIDVGYKFCIQNSSFGQHKTPSFKPKDLSNTSKWLKQVAGRKVTKQEVSEDALMNVFSKVVNPKNQKKWRRLKVGLIARNEVKGKGRNRSTVPAWT